MNNHAWARDEFGEADLGDARRNQRLVRTAAKIATQPAGTVTSVFKRGADREAVYRLLERDSTAVEALATSAHRAAARRCAAYDTVIVPIDGSSLKFNDLARRKGLGPIGTREGGAQGIHVMTSLAVSPDGTTLGILDQQYWTRPQLAPVRPWPGNRGKKHDRRPRAIRESFIWNHALRAVVATMKHSAPSTIPWFQMDRGADCLNVLEEAVDAGLRITVRAVHDRCVRWPDRHQSRLFLSLALRPPIGTYEFDVPARWNQFARRATMVLRVVEMPLLLPVGRKRRRIVPVHVVLATEHAPPPSQEPLHWVLLTTHKVHGVGDAIDVVAAYALRWRVEEFHKTWKSGACNVEASQLESKAAILRWVTMMASVAARIESIKRVARETPAAPATALFSRDEIDATIVLYKEGLTKKHIPYEPGDIPPLAEVTHWIASLGGHMGNPATRPPGATVIRRGLEYVMAAAAGIAACRRGKM